MKSGTRTFITGISQFDGAPQDPFRHALIELDDEMLNKIKGYAKIHRGKNPTRYADARARCSTQLPAGLASYEVMAAMDRAVFELTEPRNLRLLDEYHDPNGQILVFEDGVRW